MALSFSWRWIGKFGITTLQLLRPPRWWPLFYTGGLVGWLVHRDFRVEQSKCGLQVKGQQLTATGPSCWPVGGDGEEKLPMVKVSLRIEGRRVGHSDGRWFGSRGYCDYEDWMKEPGRQKLLFQKGQKVVDYEHQQLTTRRRRIRLISFKYFCSFYRNNTNYLNDSPFTLVLQFYPKAIIRNAIVIETFLFCFFNRILNKI